MLDICCQKQLILLIEYFLKRLPSLFIQLCLWLFALLYKLVSRYVSYYHREPSNRADSGTTLSCKPAAASVLISCLEHCSPWTIDLGCGRNNLPKYLCASWLHNQHPWIVCHKKKSLSLPTVEMFLSQKKHICFHLLPKCLLHCFICSTSHKWLL